jgi:hypothetical protein
MKIHWLLEGLWGFIMITICLLWIGVVFKLLGIMG